MQIIPNFPSTRRGAKAERLVTHIEDLATRIQELDGTEDDKRAPQDQVSLEGTYMKDAPNHMGYFEGYGITVNGELRPGKLKAKVKHHYKEIYYETTHAERHLAVAEADVSRTESDYSTVYERSTKYVSESVRVNKANGEVDYSRKLFGAIPLPF